MAFFMTPGPMMSSLAIIPSRCRNFQGTISSAEHQPKLTEYFVDRPTKSTMPFYLFCIRQRSWPDIEPTMGFSQGFL